MKTIAIAVVLLFATFRNFSAEHSSPEQSSPEKLLLKDYRPRSIYKIPHTDVTKARFPVIDVHSHPYAKTPEDAERWVRTMDEVGIEKTIIMTGATGKRFDELLALYRKFPTRFSVWCGFDYDGFDKSGFGPAAVAELERCVKAGAQGVGELSDKGGGLRRTNENVMHIDDSRMDSLIEKCADLHIPINIHVGEPKWMYEPMDAHNDGLMNAYKWRLDNKTNILDHTDVVATLEHALKKHPRTTFISCHFANCCYDLSIIAHLLETYPNLSADIAARYAETAPIPRYMSAFYEKFQDRLLYGTDMGSAKSMYLTTFRILQTGDEHFYDWNLFSYHWPLHGFGLSDTVLKKVYGENARKLLAR